MTIRIDDRTAEVMRKYPEVNWSAVARRAIKDYIASREATKRYDAAVKVHTTRGTCRQKTENE